MSFSKKPITVMFFMVIFCWCVSAENVNAQINNDVQASIHNYAFQQFTAGNYERVIEIVDAAFNFGITDKYLRADAYYLRSAAHLYLKNYDEAFNDIIRSMELHYWANSFDLLSIIYHKTRRYKDALLAINRAIELNDQNLEFFRTRAIIYNDLREFENALNDINYVLSIEPQSAETLSIKSSVYIFMNELQEALDYINKAISIEPEDASFWARRGIIYYDMGNLDEALIAYSKAIDLDTSRYDLYEMRGLIFKKLGRNADALNDFNMAIRLAPNVLRLYEYRGRLHLEMGNYMESLNDLVEYARLTGDEEVQREVQRFQGELMPDIEAYMDLKQFAELLERFLK